MENSLIDSDINEGLHIDSYIKEHLRVAAKWAKFLAIIGFIFIGFMVIAVLFMIFAGATAFSALGTAGLGGGMAMTFMIIFYIIMIGISLIPALAKYRFATNTKLALASDNQQALAVAFKNMKIIFQYYGILTAIFLAFYVLILLISLIVGVSAFI